MKAVVLGVGAQGSIIAKRLNQEAAVTELVCADYNLEAAKRLEGMLKKAKAVKVNAKSKEEVLKVTAGAALIVNGLPPDFNMTLMDAALANKCMYQDLASGPVEDMEFIDAVKRQLGRDEEFKKAGLTALTNTGSAPGLVSVLARNGADKLDTVDFIGIYVYDGIWTNRFIPFWWSPETAFGDMASEPVNFVNGKFVRVKPYNDPVYIDFKGLGKRRLVDHEHEEPVTFGILSKKVFKGCKNIAFKYGGPALELSESFYKMGLLGKEPVKVGDVEVVPLDLVCKLTPPAPNAADTAAVRNQHAFQSRISNRIEPVGRSRSIQRHKLWLGHATPVDAAFARVQLGKAQTQEIEKRFRRIERQPAVGQHFHLGVVLPVRGSVRVTTPAEPPDVAVELRADVPQLMEDGDQFFAEGKVEIPR